MSRLRQISSLPANVWEFALEMNSHTISMSMAAQSIILISEIIGL
jgi:hypothetical protein